MKHKQFKIGVIAMLFVCVILTMPGSAQVPRKINYQGFLTDHVTGLPVNGAVDMIFSIYDAATGGTALWTEARTLTVTNGQYSIQLGESIPIDLLAPKPYWLGIKVGTDPEMTPREELTSVLYAIFAKYLEGITIKDGKVGIGTDDPQEMLDVHGNAHIRGVLHVGPNSITIGGQDTFTPNHQISTNTPDNNNITFALDNMNATGNVNASGNINSEGNITAAGTLNAGSISTTGLNVNGKISGEQMCIKGTCRDTWPDPCSCLPVCPTDGQVLQYKTSTASWECGVVIPTPTPTPTVTPTPTPVPKQTLYRWLNYGSDRAGDWTDYMDSLSSTQPHPAFNDGRCTLGEVLTVQVAGTKPLYGIGRPNDTSCIDIKDDHMTSDIYDELVVKCSTTYESSTETTFGYIYISQVSGTVPLYRKYQNYSYNSRTSRDYMSTLNKNEIGPITGDGWVYEKILGYIIAPSSESCQ